MPNNWYLFRRAAVSPRALLSAALAALERGTWRETQIIVDVPNGTDCTDWYTTNKQSSARLRTPAYDGRQQARAACRGRPCNHARETRGATALREVSLETLTCAGRGSICWPAGGALSLHRHGPTSVFWLPLSARAHRVTLYLYLPHMTLCRSFSPRPATGASPRRWTLFFFRWRGPFGCGLGRWSIRVRASVVRRSRARRLSASSRTNSGSRLGSACYGGVGFLGFSNVSPVYW